MASERAAKATERSVMASERAAALAEQDAKCRRLESVLEVVVKMREVFNEQLFVVHEGDTTWTPGPHSAEALDRLVLCRRLESRLVLVEHQLDASSPAKLLTTTYLWTTNFMEQAIDEVKGLLKATASTA